jgi:hypothetical protein
MERKTMMGRQGRKSVCLPQGRMRESSFEIEIWVRLVVKSVTASCRLCLMNSCSYIFWSDCNITKLFRCYVQAPFFPRQFKKQEGEWQSRGGLWYGARKNAGRGDVYSIALQT